MTTKQVQPHESQSAEYWMLGHVVLHYYHILRHASTCSSACVPDDRAGCEVWRSSVSIRVSELEHRCRVLTDMCPMACLFLRFTHKAKNTLQHSRETQRHWVEDWIIRRTEKLKVTASPRWCMCTLNKGRMFRRAVVTQPHRLVVGECIAVWWLMTSFKSPYLWLPYFSGKPDRFGIGIFGTPLLWLESFPSHPSAALLHCFFSLICLKCFFQLW